MRLYLTIFFLILSGCAQLMNGQRQPVIMKDANKKIMFTTCSGAVEDWYSCNQKAENTCEKGYYVIEKFENIVGGRRELTFKCN